MSQSRLLPLIVLDVSEQQTYLCMNLSYVTGQQIQCHGVVMHNV